MLCRSLIWTPLPGTPSDDPRHPLARSATLSLTLPPSMRCSRMQPRLLRRRRPNLPSKPATHPRPTAIAQSLIVPLSWHPPSRRLTTIRTVWANSLALRGLSVVFQTRSLRSLGPSHLPDTSLWASSASPLACARLSPRLPISPLPISSPPCFRHTTSATTAGRQ